MTPFDITAPARILFGRGAQVNTLQGAALSSPLAFLQP